MKALKKARAELKKAEAKRDKTKEQLEADEYYVKECQAAVNEAENNEFVGMVRELNLTVEEFAILKEQIKNHSLAFVQAAREERSGDDESVKDEEE